MSGKIIDVVANVASAFFSHNHMRAEEVPSFLASLHDAFSALDKPKEVTAEKPRLAVSIPWKKTIKADYLISLVDGKHYKTMRRHLSLHGMTPGEYRARYDLPQDYPIVAAAYSERRSALAREAGLGQRKLKAVDAEAQAIEVADAVETDAAAWSSPVGEAPAPIKRKRGRPAKVAAAA